MDKRIIRFGSRRSALALAQTKLVMEAVARAHPELAVELIAMETTGDRNMKPFSEASDKFGIKGLFTQELEEALLSGAIDVAVHSLKDMPMNANPALPLVAYSKREDPRDALVLPEGQTELGAGAIGCSSARRRVQLAALYPGARIEPVRGNVNTRLRKLDGGEFSALVLAAAGLKRLGLEGRATRYFETDEMIPAPGQGILACQGRAGEDYYYLAAVRDEEAAACAAAERAFSAALGGGCTAPVGAFARLDGEEITIIGLYADESGRDIRRGTARGAIKEKTIIATKLAQELSGGEEL
ncbi:MAG: hydroxymethylbilane synthase [bacterium]|nr:hydroxymethylbilane synthase [bacterium]